VKGQPSTQLNNFCAVLSCTSFVTDVVIPFFSYFCHMYVHSSPCPQNIVLLDQSFVVPRINILLYVLSLF